MIRLNEDNKLLESLDDIHVGLFWIRNEEIEIEYDEFVSVKSSIYKIDNDEKFINPSKDHESVWYDNAYFVKSRSIKSSILKKYGNHSYRHYPRGRVIYYINTHSHERYYLILLDKCYVNNTLIHDKIKSAFRISGKVKFDTDNHYVCNKCGNIFE